MKTMRNWIWGGLLAVALVGLGSGCESSSDEPHDSGVPQDGSFPSEISGTIHWLHPDVSSWPATAKLEASVGDGAISLPYDKARVWFAVKGANANPWVFVNLNGEWYAATFEYLRHGQISKPMAVLSKTGGMGDHIKVAPLSKWRPTSGERIGLMVSGLARGGLRNVKERSNVVMVTWP